MKNVTNAHSLRPYKVLRDYVKNVGMFSSAEVDRKVAEAIHFTEKTVQNIYGGKRSLKWSEAKKIAGCFVELCEDNADQQVLRSMVEKFLLACALCDVEAEVTSAKVNDVVNELLGQADASSGASQTTKHRFSNLPEMQISGKIIRSNLQQRIYGAIDDSKIVFLSGITGTGKTFIAQNIAKAYLSQYPEEYSVAIWYQCKTDTDSFNELITTILSAYGVTNAGNLAQAQKVEDAERYLKKQKAIIIIDSFDSLNDTNGKGELIRFITEKVPPDCIMMITCNERLSAYRKSIKFNNRIKEVKVENLTYEDWCVLSEICADFQADIKEAKDRYGEVLDRYIYNLCKGNPFIMTHMLSAVSEKLLTGISFESLREEYGYLDIDQDIHATLLNKTIKDLPDNCVRLLVTMSLFATPVCAKTLSAIAGMDGIMPLGSVKEESDLHRSILRCHNLYLIERYVNNDEMYFYLPVMLYQILENEIMSNPAKYQDIIDNWIVHYVDFASRIGFCFDNFDQLAQLDGEGRVREIDNVIRVLKYCQINERWEDYYKISENTKYYFYTRGISGIGPKSVHYIRAHAARKLGNYADEFDSLMYHCNVMCKSQSLIDIDNCISRLNELERIVLDIPERNLMKYQYLKGLHKYSIGQYEKAILFFEGYESKAKQIFESDSELKNDRILTHDYIACLRWHAECIISTIVKHGKLDVSDNVLEIINSLLDDAIRMSEPIKFDRAIVHSLLIKVKIAYELRNDVAMIRALLVRLQEYESVIKNDAVYRKLYSEYKQVAGGG